MRCWIPDPLSADVERALQRLERSNGVISVAVMPDVHLSKDVCIGTVVHTQGLIYPQCVGGDIGCGVAALAFDGEGCTLDGVLTKLQKMIPIRSGRNRTLPQSLQRPLSAPQLQRLQRRLGAKQLGTLGRGNHFVELQMDTEQRLWAMVHSGSRAPGPAIRDHHLAVAEPQKGGLAALEPANQVAYLADVMWARTYAQENRLRMLMAVSVVLTHQPDWSTYRDCDHNHVTPHAGGWIHRKGAIEAKLNQPGIIPGSMGSNSFHVRGRGCAAALWSSSHGAGRRMSRHQARQQISVKQLHREAGNVLWSRRLQDQLREEAPGAYKDISTVMRAQRELTCIERTLTPLLVHKGG